MCRKTGTHGCVPYGTICAIRVIRAKKELPPRGLDPELMEPEEGDYTYWEFLQTKGEGVLQSAKSDRVSYANLDTVKTLGVILELLQRKYQMLQSSAGTGSAARSTQMARDWILSKG